MDIISLLEKCTRSDVEAFCFSNGFDIEVHVLVIHSENMLRGGGVV